MGRMGEKRKRGFPFFSYDLLPPIRPISPILPLLPVLALQKRKQRNAMQKYANAFAVAAYNRKITTYPARLRPLKMAIG
jgi:hypothetical protein